MTTGHEREAVNIQGLKAALQKFKTDKVEQGSYPGLTAGNVIGELRQEAEFTYRTSAGSDNIESGYKVDRGGSIQGVKGNTVAWNQLVNGDFTQGSIPDKVKVSSTPSYTSDGAVFPASTAAWGTGVRYDTVTNPTIVPVSGHKYCVYYKLTTAGACTLRLIYCGVVHDIITTAAETKEGRLIGECGANSNVNIVYLLNSAASASWTLKYFSITDLTLIYGAGNEPDTVEQFEQDFQKWFGKPLSYEAYDAGSLRPVNMSGIKTVGFNAWDEEWMLGIIDGRGAILEGDRIVSKNLIPVIEGLTYHFRVGTSNNPVGRYELYDSNGRFVKYVGSSISSLSIPSGIKYIRFCTNADYGTTYNHDICVNLSHSGSKDGEYEPHWSAEQALPITSLTGKVNGEGSSVTVFPDGMKKAGSVYDEIYRDAAGRTHAVKRVGSVDLGTLDWTYSSSNTFTYSGLGEKYDTVINYTCPKYAAAAPVLNTSGYSALDDKSFSLNYGSDNWTKGALFIKDTSYSENATGATALKTALSGVILYYELAEPMDYILDNFELPAFYQVDDWGTEEIVPVSGQKSVAPVLSLKYGINAGDTIGNLPRNYVSATQEQLFTDEQKIRARKNIGLDHICPAGVCYTAATVAAKTANVPHYMLFPGNLVAIRFNSAISVAEPTLNISGTGEKSIYLNGNKLQPGVVRPGMSLLMRYDGNIYDIISMTGLEQSASESDLWVDMGLPSGTRWAKKNIDVTQADGFAASEYQYEGTFFSWGNTQGHNPTSTSAFDYDWGTANDGPYASTPGAALTGNMSPSFDAARANLGAPWRMPTTEEFKELFDNCDFIDASGNTIAAATTNKLTTMNGIAGIRIKSKINGNTLFFPCSGGGSGSSWNRRGSYGYYWSSSLYSSTRGRYLDISSGGVGSQTTSTRFDGLAVRAVQ